MSDLFRTYADLGGTLTSTNSSAAWKLGIGCFHTFTFSLIRQIASFLGIFRVATSPQVQSHGFRHPRGQTITPSSRV